MSKSAPKFDGPRIPELPRMDIDLMVRAVLKLMIENHLKQSGLTMAELAEEVSKIAGVKISAATLYAWKEESKAAWRIPLTATPALCYVCKSLAIFELALNCLQKSATGFEERQFENLGRQLLNFSRARRSMRRMLAELEKGVA